MPEALHRGLSQPSLREAGEGNLVPLHPTLVDSHCHLNYPDYAEGYQAVARRAREAGVAHMLTISCRESEFQDIIAIAESESSVFASIGIHPHDAKDHQHITSQHLVKYAHHPKVIGLGETGLDYYYQHSPREEQIACFEQHIAAAKATGLPLIIHTRDAEADTIALLEREVKAGGVRGLLHCFTGTETLARKAMDWGFYISFSGIVTFKKSAELREIARALPLERLLVETDAPFLAPEPFRGKRNEPAYIAYTARALSELRAISFEALAEATTENFFQLFLKAQRHKGNA